MPEKFFKLCEELHKQLTEFNSLEEIIQILRYTRLKLVESLRHEPESLSMILPAYELLYELESFFLQFFKAA